MVSIFRSPKQQVTKAQEERPSLSNPLSSTVTVVNVKPTRSLDELESYSSCPSTKNNHLVCVRQCEECIVPVPNVALPEGTSMLPGDKRTSKVIALQKMCNAVSKMQQHHIAELFPIMDSRETTEGSEEQNICRICHVPGDEQLITPCRCSGSAKFVHATCLVTWFKKSVKNQCELCRYQVSIKKKSKPVSKWRRPEEKPIPLIWFFVFFIGLFLNILSIYVNASEHCRSTPCLIFYVVNGFGIILDAAFLYFWWLKCFFYWKKWCAINQNWYIIDKGPGRGSRDTLKAHVSRDSVKFQDTVYPLQVGEPV